MCGVCADFSWHNFNFWRKPVHLGESPPAQNPAVCVWVGGGVHCQSFCCSSLAAMSFKAEHSALFKFSVNIQ